MTEVEYKRLKGILDAIAEQQKMLAVRTLDVEGRFAPVEKGIADLLAAVKKRISNRD
jgi:hypothetical protein